MARDVIFSRTRCRYCILGVAEPLTHYLHSPFPKDVPNQSAESARVAMGYTFFHWGYHNGQSSLWLDLSWHISNLERSEMV